MNNMTARTYGRMGVKQQRLNQYDNGRTRMRADNDSPHCCGQRQTLTLQLRTTRHTY